jgi:hypothetical protein
MGGMRPVRGRPNPWMSLAASPRIWPAREAADIDQDLNRAQDGLTLKSIRGLVLELELDLPVSDGVLPLPTHAGLTTRP